MATITPLQREPMLDENGNEMIDENGQPMWSQPQNAYMTPEQQQQMQMQQQMQQMQNQVNTMQQVHEYENIESCMKRLEHGVVIKQQFEIMEALSGCEFPNTYYVYGKKAAGSDKSKGKKEFKYSEKSSCMDRCMTGNCKPFKMKVKNQQKIADDQIAMRLQKDCKCTYYCFNRPEMKCFLDETGEEADLGTCYDACDIYNFTYELRTEGTEVEYYIKASVCQCYFWCKCPCSMCNVVTFYVKEPGNDEPVSEITRTGRDCLKNAITGTGADEFVCTFPQNSNWRQRAMLMNLVVFIDYSMFEETSEQNKNHS